MKTKTKELDINFTKLEWEGHEFYGTRKDIHWLNGILRLVDILYDEAAKLEAVNMSKKSKKINT